MAKQLKIVDAGAIQDLFLYDRISPFDPPRVRAAKQKASSEAQKRMNLKNTSRQVEWRLAKNFPTAGSGRWYTLTYDKDHLPEDPDPKVCRKKVLQDKDAFLKALRKERAAAGLPAPRAAGCIEVLTSRSGRWHIHILIDATGDDDEMVRRCWKKGTDIEVRPLRVDKEKNHETLARYMTKEMRELQDRCCSPGAHVWFFTRNCLKVEIETVTVPDDYELNAPEGCEVLIDRKEQTEFTSWHHQKLRVGAAALPKRPKAKHRKRRRC